MTHFIFVLTFKTICASENFAIACGCALEGRKFYQRSRGEQEKSLQSQQSHLGRFSSCEKFALRDKRNIFRSKESESRRLCVLRPMTTPVLVWCRYGERVASRFATRKRALPKELSAEGKGRSGEKFRRSITGLTRNLRRSHFRTHQRTGRRIPNYNRH